MFESGWDDLRWTHGPRIRLKKPVQMTRSRSKEAEPLDSVWPEQVLLLEKQTWMEISVRFWTLCDWFLSENKRPALDEEQEMKWVGVWRESGWPANTLRERCLQSDSCLSYRLFKEEELWKTTKTWGGESATSSCVLLHFLTVFPPSKCLEQPQ